MNWGLLWIIWTWVVGILRSQVIDGIVILLQSSSILFKPPAQRQGQPATCGQLGKMTHIYKHWQFLVPGSFRECNTGLNHVLNTFPNKQVNRYNASNHHLPSRNAELSGLFMSFCMEDSGLLLTFAWQGPKRNSPIDWKNPTVGLGVFSQPTRLLVLAPDTALDALATVDGWKEMFHQWLPKTSHCVENCCWIAWLNKNDPDVNFGRVRCFGRQ